MIIEKQNFIQTLCLSKIHLEWLKMSKYPQKISAFFNDAPLIGLFSVSALVNRPAKTIFDFHTFFFTRGKLIIKLVQIHNFIPFGASKASELKWISKFRSFELLCIHRTFYEVIFDFFDAILLGGTLLHINLNYCLNCLIFGHICAKRLILAYFGKL